MKISHFFLAITCFLAISCHEDPVTTVKTQSLDEMMGRYFEIRYNVVWKNEGKYWEHYDKQTEMFSEVKSVLKHWNKQDRITFYITTFCFDLYLDTESLEEWGRLVTCNGDLDVLKKHTQSILSNLKKTSINDRWDRLKEMLLFLNSINGCYENE